MSRLSKWRLIWQKKPAKQLPGSEITKEDYAFQPEAIQYKATLLRTCREVVLDTFIECYFFDNYAGIGTGTPEEIGEAWMEVVSEYLSLMKNTDTDNYLEVGNEIMQIKWHVLFVTNACFFLSRRFDQEIVDKLIAYGYPGEYPENDTIAMAKQLDRVLSLSKTQQFRLSELNDEMDRLNVEKHGSKSTPEQMEKDIQRLGKYQGYKIDKKTTTVYEYAQIHNNYFDDIVREKRINRNTDE